MENMKFKSVTFICLGKQITDITCIEFTQEELNEAKKSLVKDDNLKDIDYHESIILE